MTFASPFEFPLMSVSLDLVTFDDSALENSFDKWLGRLDGKTSFLKSSFPCIGWFENLESEEFGELIPFEVTSFCLNELLEPNVG